MTRNKVELDRIVVASPCPAAWENMAGDERVRFCNQCNLNVYNISAMTKAEAESVFRNTEGRVCARLFRRSDGTILTQDCPVGLRAIRKRVSRAAAAAFSALLSLFGGQTLIAQQQNPKDQSIIDILRTFRGNGQAAVEGIISDQVNAVVAGAQVKLINESTKREITTRTNERGRFRFIDIDSGEYTIVADSPGFRKLEFSGLKLEEDVSLNLTVKLAVGTLEMIGVTVTSETIPTIDKFEPGELKRKERPRE